ncbi:hypothetical protein JIR001_24910 [Polycladomyces abyssicola]|uniref:N-acetyltransferase domain-containing protein n=1 Tax=Polycladomyces abyssicola TaxID=1125966 RepID=A0A8D5UHA2_9BACL|nr:GNAT family N-acetyltransferase [Polycladomyces abyssicola]BCU82708.1 hypothetical protein JIR001_24910 [Polycladomyces abyssicola]
MKVRLRPSTDADFEFVFALNKTNMRRYVERLRGWDDAAERADMKRKFQPGVDQIIEVDGHPAGVFAVDRREDEWDLRHIELLPIFQNRGIGTTLIRQLLEEAYQQGAAVTLQVLKMNPARRLYERLGFYIVGETEIKYRMKAKEERNMRIALFSDIHGNVTALKAVLREIRERGPFDAVVCAGDIVFLGPSPEEVVDLLRAEGVAMVRGNCDDMVTGQLPIETEAASDPVRMERFRAHLEWNRRRLGEERLDFLRSLPVTLTFDPAPGQALLVCHASPVSTHRPLPRPDLLRTEGEKYYGETEARVIAAGHWHQPSVTLLGDRIVLNVSSVSIPGDGRPIACYTVAEWQDGIWSFEQYRVDYDLAPEIHRIRERNMPQPPWPKLEE